MHQFIAIKKIVLNTSKEKGKKKQRKTSIDFYRVFNDCCTPISCKHAQINFRVYLQGSIGMIARIIFVNVNQIKQPRNIDQLKQNTGAWARCHQ